MAKYRKKPVVIEATQFNYIDNIDGPKTCELAKSLGLSRAGSSLLWEIQTPGGWCIMYSGDWLITDTKGNKHHWSHEDFEATFEPATKYCLDCTCYSYEKDTTLSYCNHPTFATEGHENLEGNFEACSFHQTKTLAT